jgi:hypothetical protein
MTEAKMKKTLRDTRKNKINKNQRKKEQPNDIA